MTAPRSYAFADLWEMAADAVPERDALVIFGRDDGGTGRRTYAELEERANRLANHLTGLGVAAGDHVAVYLENRPEYMEVVLASYKIRAVPINVNFRYVASELVHLLGDSQATVVVHEPHFAENLDAIIDQLPMVTHRIEVNHSYEEALAASSSARPMIERSGDDHYILYTGGTTGAPKGVVWRQEDAFFSCLGGGDPMRMQGPVGSLDEIPSRIIDGTFSAVLLAPFMHAAGSWVTLMWFISGGKAVLPRGPLDPEMVWDVVQAESGNMLTVVGDAVGRPVIDAWEASPDRWDASSIFAISNGGAPMSPTLRQRIAAAFPDIVLTDGFGSSEAGTQGSARLSAAQIAASKGVAQFVPGDDTTVVLDDDNVPVEPGSGVDGRVARTGRLPIGYLGDPDKTARTFVQIDGRRFLITGDRARVAEDGTVELLGREAAIINTGGEKVHGEEVEAVLRSHPAIYDVVVVGAPDPRWGSAVCAVVQPVAGSTPTLDEIVEHCRGELAGYKLPRRLIVVEQVIRSPAGKADLRWAAATAALQ